MNTNETIAKFMGYKPLFIEEARSDMDYPRDTERLTKETLYIKESVNIQFDVNHEDVFVCYGEYDDGQAYLDINPKGIGGGKFEILLLDYRRLSIYDGWRELMKVKHEINLKDLELRACYGDHPLLYELMKKMNSCLIETDLDGFKNHASKYIQQIITK